MESGDGKTLFSIIVSACEVGSYIAEAINSIRRQTYADFEALLVVEESADNTLEICRSKTRDDPRFKIIPLPKSGSASCSRNYGIDHAEGRYLLFIDGDDWMEPDSLANFAAILNDRPNLDLIVSGARRHLQETKDKITCLNIYAQGRPGAFFETGIDFLNSIDFIHRWIPATWMNLYRHDLLRKNRLYQAAGRLHQDDEWTYRVFLKAGAVAVAPFQYYNYRLNSTSVTHGANSKSVYDRAENVNSICQFFESGDFPPSCRKMLAGYFCWQFLHGPFLQRKYTGTLVRNRLPREDCRLALCRCMGTREQFRSYCRIVLAAGGGWFLFIPLMFFARKKGFFWIAEYTFRIWFNRILPIVRRIWK